MEETSINELPVELILKIFSLLPMFKETVATHLISKRWEDPWKLVSDVMFDDNDESYESLVNFLRYVYGSLLSNDAQILERLHLKLSRNYSASDINFWVKIAVNRSVRKLRIQMFGKTLNLPTCLSTCITLKSLILHEVCIKVVPPLFRLLSLKSLHLLSVKFLGDKTVAILLQSCPVLEYLVVNQTKDDNVMFKVLPPWFRLPSLKSMHLLSVKFLGDETIASLLHCCPILEYLVVKQTKDDNVMFKFVPPWFCLPSLKSLHLLSVRFFGHETIPSLLQSCPVLEYLVINQTKDDNVMFEAVPLWFYLRSLKSLHLLSVKFLGGETIASLLQVCPVLEYLIVDQTKDDNVLFKVVPRWFCLSSLKSLHLLSVKFSGDKSVAKLLESCPVLEYLVVNNVMFKVVPRFFYLPSLKSLHLLSVKFSDDESVAKLLEGCPVLEHLVVNKTKDDNVMIFNINVPSLRSLSIHNSKGKRAYVEEKHGFVINAPSLEILDFKDTFSNSVKFEHMPEVTKANIEVICESCDQSQKLIGSFTSIQNLSLCSLTSETPYPSGTVFPYLEHLELCTCSAGWANLLASILTDAPRLQSLKLKSQHSARYNDPMNLWKEPTVVPECLSTNLEILEWRQYEGTEQERNIAAYILANATCLKMATFSTRCRNKYHRMLKKLKKLNRVSGTCQLVFE